MKFKLYCPFGESLLLHQNFQIRNVEVDFTLGIFALWTYLLLWRNHGIYCIYKKTAFCHYHIILFQKMFEIVDVVKLFTVQLLNSSVVYFKVWSSVSLCPSNLKSIIMKRNFNSNCGLLSGWELFITPYYSWSEQKIIRWMYWKQITKYICR